MLFFITSCLFFIFVLKNIFYWLYVWQIKEYRRDRLWIHLTQTDQGKNLIFGWKNMLKIGLFLLYFLSVFNAFLESLYPFLILGLYGIECVGIFQEVKKKKVKLPHFTLKTLVIIVLVFSYLGVLYLFPLLDKFFWILFIDKTVPFVIASFVGLFSLPSDFYKDVVINKAIRKMNSLHDTLRIGITGSYGKGSTKEFVSSILSQNFSVVKTEGTFNTPIGIARTILSDVDHKTEIFVAEMGAYKIGEISEMCDIVHPEIGILTAVNDQHSSLFGGIKNTITAKYELIESLPKDSLALFNGNNEIVRNLYTKSKKKKILYYVSYDGNFDSEADILAYTISAKKFSISFSVKIAGKELGVFTAPVIGLFNIENILPGIFIGYRKGMGISALKKSVSSLTPISKTMEPYNTDSGTILINDTFNANPSALRVGLDYISLYKGKKVVVLQPMIELGKNAGIDHFEMGKILGNGCDVLFLTNKNYFKWIKSGIEEVAGKCEYSVESPLNITTYIEKKLGKRDVVLFEGKEAANSFHSLRPQKVIDSS